MRVLAIRLTLAAALLPAAGCQLFQPKDQQTTQQEKSILGEGVTTKKETVQAQQVDVVKAPEQDDIFEIASLLPSNPWLRQSGKVVGLRVPAYFVSGTTRKGAFVPGTIFAWIYGFEAGPDGKTQRVPLHVWEFDRDTAMNWRITKKALMGNPYMFLLRWPDELELSGQYIELELGYERAKDKSVVTSPAKRLQVPKEDVAPMPPAAPPPASRMANTRKAG